MNYTKKCSSCQQEKSHSSFSFKNKSLKKLHSRCKECQSIAHQKHYQSNKGQYIKRSSKSNKLYRSRNKKFINEYKSSMGCQFCNENHPACLDFHHISPTEKTANISRIANCSKSIESIQNEIDKCILVCANCHRKIHAGIISIC